MEYKISLQINAKDEEQARKIQSGLQAAASKVNGNDLLRMLNKLAKNPSWISLATKLC